MTIQIVPPDKAAVRDLTEEAIATGLPDADLRRMRADLAAQLGVSAPSLRGVSAYVAYSATQAIEAAGLKGRISNRQLAFAARLTRGSETLESDVAVLAADIGISAGELSRALSLYEELYQGRPGGVQGNGPKPSASAPEPKPETHAPTASGTVDEARPEGPAPCVLPIGASPALLIDEDTPDINEDTGTRGDTANYDFPAKREWRAFWARYIRDRFGPGRLREAKVICLPGRDVESEVSMYLAMGIRPENIYAVEGSPRVREQFVRNAERLGIRYFTEPLEQVLKNVNVRFDIVSYDFHGQFCNSHQRDLELTPLADDAIVIYNAMAKREDATTKETLRDAKAAMVESAATARNVLSAFDDPREAARFTRYLLPAGPSGVDAPEFASTDFGRLRRETVPSIVSATVGYCHWELNRPLMMRALNMMYWSFDRESASPATDRELRRWISPAVGDFRLTATLSMATLVKLLADDFNARIVSNCEPADLGLVAWHATFGRPYWVGKGFTYDYLSETKSEGPRSRFLTTVKQIRQASTVLSAHGPAIDFATAWITEWWRRKRGPPSAPDYKDGIFDVLDQRDMHRPLGSRLEWSDKVCVLRNGKPVASVHLGDLRGAMLAATAARKKERLAL